MPAAATSLNRPLWVIVLAAASCPACVVATDASLLLNDGGARPWAARSRLIRVRTCPAAPAGTGATVVGAGAGGAATLGATWVVGRATGAATGAAGRAGAAWGTGGAGAATGAG